MVGDSCSFKSGGPRKASFRTHFSSREVVSLLLLLLFSYSAWLIPIYLSFCTPGGGHRPKSLDHVLFLIALRISAALLP